MSAGRQRGKGIEKPGPDRARRAVLRRYIRRGFPAGGHSRASIAPRADGPGGPCLPDCFPDASLAGLSRHPDSPASSPFSMQERRPQVEGQRKFNCAFLARRIDLAGRVAVVLKPGQPPRLGLVGIDRLGLVVASAGMGDVIDAAAQRAAVPGIDQIKRQRRVNRNGRMQARGRLPGLEADAGDRLAGAAGLPSSASACRCR